jgi:hypothetical protein
MASTPHGASPLGEPRWVAMSSQRLRPEHPPDGSEARSGAPDVVLTLWIVALFLGGLVASHYVLRRVLVGGGEMASGVSSGWLLL